MEKPQSINQLIADVEALKRAQEQYNQNFANLVARSEFTAGIISAMIADGLIKREGIIKYVENVEIKIPGYQSSVEGARESFIKLLNSVKIS
ncbi:hypothetical protein C1Y41_05890 [Pantoea sp. ICBG 1758]|uniref:hypothetical protein n=1 Tax=Pantoea sp. ICBG 1758 TaxID=2071682 RepID=UPI000CE4B8DA|nr:hypothetical protein [Pantoea sp. ICBG 1758]PPC64168.1 hypothetical protein C1Y41_05890 [Pantoea sp. ICBG 1758]